MNVNQGGSIELGEESAEADDNQGNSEHQNQGDIEQDLRNADGGNTYLASPTNAVAYHHQHLPELFPSSSYPTLCSRASAAVVLEFP